MKAIDAPTSNVLYTAHLNKKEHVFCENREYWPKGHRSGVALGFLSVGKSSCSSASLPQRAFP
jgi:hypothetical protein